MAKRLFIAFAPGAGLEAGPARWQLFEGSTPAGGGAGDLSEAAPLAPGARVIVLVPSETLLLADVELPGRNQQRLRQALPYAMEERLVDDVDAMHFVLGPRLEGQRYGAAAVHRQRMAAWLEVLHDAGIQPDALVPDVFAVPLLEDAWSALLEGARVLVRTSRASGFATMQDTAPLLLEQAVREAGGDVPTHLKVYDAAGTGGDYLRPAGSQPALDAVPFAAGLLGLAAEAEQPESALNLLQGEYSPRAQISRRLRPWYATGVLLLLLVLIQPALFLYDYWGLAARSAVLQGQIESVFRQSFPDAKRIVNPRVQMQQRLKALRQRSGGGGALLEILSAAGPLLAKEPGVQVQSLRYRKGQLEVELEVKDFQQLDRLKQQLAQAGKWSIDVQSATARGERVQGRLLIRS